MYIYIYICHQVASRVQHAREVLGVQQPQDGGVQEALQASDGDGVGALCPRVELRPVVETQAPWREDQPVEGVCKGKESVGLMWLI